MILNATDIKNNFGKILKLLDFEDIIIKKNGRVIAKVIKYEEPLDTYGTVREEAVEYHPNDRKITYEEFLKLTATSEERYEYIDGQVYLLASPRVTHQMITGHFHAQLFVQLKDKKCQPFISPFDITLTVDKKKNVVQPDFGIICDFDQYTDEKDRYMGVPALVAEVLSESSVSKDMVRKLQTYMLAGVKEYWIINPKSEVVMVYAFKDFEIVFHTTYKKGEGVKSYHFKHIVVEW
jgi:Uma2 family endonuclease